MKQPAILVIDGQGGRIGSLLIEGLLQRLPGADIATVGTNSIATSTMMKAGAKRGGTGENAVLVNARTADYILGSIGIVIADSMMGEISPAIAAAIGQSPAARILVPLNLCNSFVAGLSPAPVKELISLALDELQRRMAEQA